VKDNFKYPHKSHSRNKLPVLYFYDNKLCVHAKHIILKIKLVLWKKDIQDQIVSLEQTRIYRCANYLYAIPRWKNILVASVFSTTLLNISFQRGNVGNNLALWYRLVVRVAHIMLNGMRDKFVWGLLQSGVFSVSSMYKALILDTRVRDSMVLWKMKVPLRIKIFCDIWSGVWCWPKTIWLGGIGMWISCACFAQLLNLFNTYFLLSLCQVYVESGASNF
jgi:hypothetical protein